MLALKKRNLITHFVAFKNYSIRAALYPYTYRYLYIDIYLTVWQNGHSHFVKSNFSHQDVFFHKPVCLDLIYN